MAKILEGTKSLGLNKGDIKLGGNIIKIGGSELEVKTENGKRNYTDISDHSSFNVIFHTSLGELNIKVYHSIDDDNNIQVSVEDKKIWSELQRIGEVVGENCLFGGISVNEAVEKGGFVRSGRWNNKVTEKIKNSTDKGETWVNKISHDKTSSIER